MNVVFWNLNKKDLTDVIKEIAEENDIDVFVFCEYMINDYKFLTTVNSEKKIFQEVEDFGNDKLKIYSTLGLKNFRPLKISNRWHIFEVKIPFYPNFIFVTAHLISKVNFKETSQLLDLTLLRNDIDEAIQDSGLERVILLGDLNINPFEEGMMASTGLHSTMDKAIALKEGRKVQGNVYKYFYNPMWNFLGDESLGKVAGTHFYRSSEHISYDWNVYDQLLYTPSLIDYIDVQNIDIVFKTNSFNLVNKNGRIDKKYSDHLPLKFKIKNI